MSDETSCRPCTSQVMTQPDPCVCLVRSVTENCGEEDQEIIKQKHMEITLSRDGCEVHVWKCRMTSGAPVSDHVHNGVVPISKAIVDGARPRLWRRHFDRADITILSEDECRRMNEIPEPALRD